MSLDIYVHHTRPIANPDIKKETFTGYFALQVIQHDIIMPYMLKKCCKKYKKGKRCKKCPAN